MISPDSDRFTKVDRSQLLMFSRSLDERIEDGDMVRLVEQFVANLDLVPFYEKYSAEGGRVLPVDTMLSILLLAYSQDIYSSRRIAWQVKKNADFIYLSGDREISYKAISEFRRIHLGAIRPVLAQFGGLAVELGLVDPEKVFNDGVKLKANASDNKTKSAAQWVEEFQKMEARAESFLKRAEEADQKEEALVGDRELYKVRNANKAAELLAELAEQQARVAELAAEGRFADGAKVNITDPDASFKKVNGKITTAHEVQVASSNQYALAVTESPAPAEHALGELLDEVREATGRYPEVCAQDAEYHTSENISAAVQRGVLPLSPEAAMETGKGAAKAGRGYGYHRFEYDVEQDCYRCPGGRTLDFVGQSKPGPSAGRNYKCRSGCDSCPLREECFRDPGRLHQRHLWVDDRKQLRVFVLSVLATHYGRAIYRKRKQDIEVVFAGVKHNHLVRRLLLRGWPKVVGEFRLLLLVNNLRKLRLRLGWDGEIRDRLRTLWVAGGAEAVGAT